MKINTSLAQKILEDLPFIGMIIVLIGLMYVCLIGIDMVNQIINLEISTGEQLLSTGIIVDIGSGSQNPIYINILIPICVIILCSFIILFITITDK